MYDTEYFDDSFGFQKLELEAGASITTTVSMKWVANQTKDFSLVAWSTGNTPANIYSTNSVDGKSKAWPLIEMNASNDENTATPTGADACSANTSEVIFNEYV